MEELDYNTLPDWLKNMIMNALKTAGRQAAIAVCKKYISNPGVCEIAVPSIIPGKFE